MLRERHFDAFRIIIGALAERDIREARAWFDERESGLGDQFFERVNETVRRIASNPELYRPIFRDARRAPSRRFTTPSGIVSRLIRRSSSRASVIGETCRWRGAERSSL